MVPPVVPEVPPVVEGVLDVPEVVPVPVPAPPAVETCCTKGFLRVRNTSLQTVLPLCSEAELDVLEPFEGEGDCVVEVLVVPVVLGFVSALVACVDGGGVSSPQDTASPTASTTRSRAAVAAKTGEPLKFSIFLIIASISSFPGYQPPPPVPPPPVSLPVSVLLGAEAFAGAGLVM